jgi:endonuclease YncB( thermonuclease family)
MKEPILIILILLTLNCFGTITKVTRVIDGDTFETVTGEKVRLIGINCPELTDIFGEEARIYLSQIIEGQTIDLISDNISNDRDRYGRLLRYIVLNGVDINKQMILDGYAFAYLKYHFEKENEYKQAQLTAQKYNTGIWGNAKKDTIIKEQEKKENSFLSFISVKTFIILALTLILIITGTYYYLKR